MLSPYVDKTVVPPLEDYLADVGRGDRVEVQPAVEPEEE